MNESGHLCSYSMQDKRTWILQAKFDFLILNRTGKWGRHCWHGVRHIVRTRYRLWNFKATGFFHNTGNAWKFSLALWILAHSVPTLSQQSVAFTLALKALNSAIITIAIIVCSITKSATWPKTLLRKIYQISATRIGHSYALPEIAQHAKTSLLLTRIKLIENVLL